MNSVRLTWLVRRVRRMTWREVPWRAATVVRGGLQGRGWLTADRVPARARDARFGRSWCRVPALTTAERDALRAAGEALLAGRLSVFGRAIDMPGGVPDWNADPVTGGRIPLDFGLSIDFRHLPGGIDIKFLWEVNRHLWWVTLAQAWAATGDTAFLRRLGVLIDSWLDACPYARGANWSSPVEHGIRLINWSLVWHLIGGEASPLFAGEAGQALRGRWLDCIYRHVRFARDNYSFYSSADNHLIGEVAGVFVALHTWDCWQPARALRDEAKTLLERETLKQFAPDGVNREQSTCYHKFSLQFVLAAGLCGRANGDDFGAATWRRVEAATAFLAAVTDTAGNVPAIGDSDDGEVWRLGGAGPGAASGYATVRAVGALLSGRGDLLAKVAALGRPAPALAAWLLDPDDAPAGGPAALSGMADGAASVIAAAADAAGDAYADTEAARATAAAAAVAADAAATAALPTFFPEGGYALLGRRLHAPDELRVLVDCGPLGYNRIAGHGHADALAVLLSSHGEPLLVDAGTYCYNAAPELRHFFRGTSAHNTLVVDGLDQSVYGASFLWLRDVHCAIARHDAAAGVVEASHDGYRRLPDPVRHHRRVSLLDSDAVLVEDWLDARRPHRVTLAWHGAAGTGMEADGRGGWTLRGATRQVAIACEAPQPAEAAVVAGRETPPQGWVSTAFYARSAAPVLQIDTVLAPGQVLRTQLVVSARASVREAAHEPARDTAWEPA